MPRNLQLSSLFNPTLRARHQPFCRDDCRCGKTSDLRLAKNFPLPWRLLNCADSCWRCRENRLREQIEGLIRSAKELPVCSVRCLEAAGSHRDLATRYPPSCGGHGSLPYEFLLARAVSAQPLQAIPRDEAAAPWGQRQLSTIKVGTRAYSLVFELTRIAPAATAVAAMTRSFGPIGCARSDHLRSACTAAARRPKGTTRT